MKNREIKFRAWDENSKQMIYNPDFLIIDNGHYAVGTLDSESKWYSVDDYLDGGIYPYKTILMQYTGLKDKNGKEIYEGDLLERINYANKKELYVMTFGIFDTEDGYVMAFHLVYPNFNDQSYNHEAGELEIIGNIYESPELLKEHEKRMQED